jgi:Transposase DDE domain
VLTLRTVFQLALRQAEGFAASLIHLMGLDLETPDHTTLSRRSATVMVPPRVPVHAGPVARVMDSTGPKLVGNGEWDVLGQWSRDGTLREEAPASG